MSRRRPASPSLPLFPVNDGERAKELGRCIGAEYDAVCQAEGTAGWRDLLVRRRSERVARVRFRRLAEQQGGVT